MAFCINLHQPVGFNVFSWSKKKTVDFAQGLWARQTCGPWTSDHGKSYKVIIYWTLLNVLNRKLKKIEARLLDRNRLHKMEMSLKCLLISAHLMWNIVEHSLCSAEAGKSAIMNAILDCQDLGHPWTQVLSSSSFKQKRHVEFGDQFGLAPNGWSERCFLLKWICLHFCQPKALWFLLRARYVSSMPRSNQCSVSKGSWELWLGPSFGGGCRNWDSSDYLMISLQGYKD